MNISSIKFRSFRLKIKLKSHSCYITMNVGAFHSIASSSEAELTRKSKFLINL